MKKLAYDVLYIVLIVTFIALIAGLFLLENFSSVVWTAVVPFLPFGLLVIGFSNWRNVCPLAFFSKISQNIKFKNYEKIKVPIWFEKNFYIFQYSLLYIALVLRLTTLNYDDYYLGVFFIFVILAAFFANLVYTGKTWCNFFCPVGVVEKIYTLSNAKNYDHNSACSSCTACKRNCPDIDLENNYWRESEIKQKNIAFYSFPGLILGFYLYFYLQSGSYEYYFTGVWSSTALDITQNGFFFAPSVPIFVAAPISLLFFMIISYYLFVLVEMYLIKFTPIKSADEKTIGHIVKAIASFVAFNTFYAYAGAPTFLQYPTFYSVFYFFIVFVSSAVLYKELFRKEDFFIQERFALKILDRWDSDKPAPDNLTEVYYTSINETKYNKSNLTTYKNTVKELMQEGILNRDSMLILDKLRKQIGISQKEHEDTLRVLKLKYEELFDENMENTSERKYQIQSYEKMLKHALDEHMQIDVNYISTIQKELNIDQAMHKKILYNILGSSDIYHKEVMNLLQKLEDLLKIQLSIYTDGSREFIFLKYTVKYEYSLVIKDLFALFFTIYPEHSNIIQTLLRLSKNKQIDDSFLLNEETLSFMNKETVTKIISLFELFKATLNGDGTHTYQHTILELLHHESTPISCAALLVAKHNLRKSVYEEYLEGFLTSNNEDKYNLAYKLKYDTDDITLYEKMMHLHYVEVFSKIKFQDLRTLAEVSQIRRYAADEFIIEQGGIGDTLFVIMKGSANTIVNNTITKQIVESDYFGEIALIGDIKRRASVKTLEPTTTITISKYEFKKFLFENPKVSNKIMKSMIQKMLDIEETVLNQKKT